MPERKGKRERAREREKKPPADSARHRHKSNIAYIGALTKIIYIYHECVYTYTHSLSSRACSGGPGYTYCASYRDVAVRPLVVVACELARGPCPLPPNPRAFFFLSFFRLPRIYTRSFFLSLSLFPTRSAAAAAATGLRPLGRMHRERSMAARELSVQRAPAGLHSTEPRVVRALFAARNDSLYAPVRAPIPPAYVYRFFFRVCV